MCTYSLIVSLIKLSENKNHKLKKLPEIINDLVCPVDAKEELLDECESIWKQTEEVCKSRLMLLGTETLQKSDAKLSLLMMRVKALTAEYNQWQKRSPEIISTNPDVLVALGKELQKVKNGLEMVLSTVQSKNKKIEEDLKREQQWHEEQEQILDALNGIEEEMKKQVVRFSEKRAFQELKNKMLKLRAYKEELLNALGEFLEEHFPFPEKGGSAKKKKNSSEEPAVQLITLHEVLEILINKLMSTPHEPYLTINDFWPPYIELLLRYGIALIHPEDPIIRLEAFHQ
ncbi:LOW QUALITY PROTEIN: centromere protein K-like [Sarcoramphus papa]